MRIFVNPGHDRSCDPGACGYGLEEADVAYNIGKYLAELLEDEGYTISGFMQDDSLGDVCRFANNCSADIFVSIHCNAFNGRAKGTETLCYQMGGESEMLATCIQEEIVDSLGTIDRGVKARPDLYVLRCTKMPAVLVECAFIDEVTDNALLDELWRDFAEAICRGIKAYALYMERNNE